MISSRRSGKFEPIGKAGNNKIKMLKTLVMAAALLLAGVGIPVSAQQQDPDLARLEKGTILVHSEKDPASGDRVGVGKVIFQAPLETAWAVITDYVSYPKFVSDVRELKVEKKEGNQRWVRMKLKNVWPFPDYNLLLAIDESRESGSIRFQLKEGDFTRYYGSWKLSRLDQSRTMAEYRLFQYVGWWWFPLVPNALTNNSLVSSHLNNFQKRISDVQIENSLAPEKVIKPFWRKSNFKDGKEDKSKTGSQKPAPSPEEQKK